ncbi:MAG: ATP-dependent RNA helicase HrpA [Deltaproteobacteria bacterium]|nr:ATP-dependent RNA helicase HrpA [Deltaproteobacteria bacterium]
MTLRTIDTLRRRLPAAMAVERARAGRELARLRRRAAAGEPVPERRLRVIAEQLRHSADRKQERRALVPPLAYDPALPISAHRQAIVDAIRRHPVVIVAGETGSGKTTQLPKFCLEAGRGLDGMIGCTQPRRIAALTVARRIAEELGQAPGQTVGHKIRFHEKTGHRTLVKIMTDGILLAEAQRDRDLLAYDTLIVDEAHERSLNIDFILGLLRRMLRRRRDLKLIVTSATIDTEKFAAAFDDAPVIEVSGRMYPVRIHYRPLDESGDEDASSHVEAAVAAVDEIERRGPFGDVLVFMPTEQDIRDTVELLASRGYRGSVILPLFARLSAADQMRVFAPAAGRKIVVATNVAETSLTIPGIRYVVDSGLARISRYSPRTRTTALPVVPISRASCDQRAGRCGRVADGVCFRLYSQADYESRPRFTAPEILRTNLAEAVLRMIALNLGDIADFPFIDRPADKSIRDGIALLEELGAVAPTDTPRAADARLGGRRLRLTPMGRRMARLPLDPRLARMLIEARQRGCGPEMAVIAAALSINDVRERPADQSAAADQAHAAFVDRSSDFLTLLNIWRAYQQALATEKTASRVRRWSKRHFLSYKRLREWRDIHDQLAAVMAELEADGPAADAPPDAGNVHRDALHRSILAGFLGNIARRRDKNLYQAARGRQVMIFPGSGLFNRAGEWIVAAEMVETSRLFARTVARLAGGRRRRPVSTHLHQPALGTPAGRGGGRRAGHPLRLGYCRRPDRPLWSHRSRGSLGDLHPQRPGRGRSAPAPALHGAQPGPGRRGPRPGRQDPAPRRAGFSRRPLPVLPPAPAGHLSSRRPQAAPEAGRRGRPAHAPRGRPALLPRRGPPFRISRPGVHQRPVLRLRLPLRPRQPGRRRNGEYPRRHGRQGGP